MMPLALFLHDERVIDLLGACGTRYYWARGNPATPWAALKDGTDCSGFAQMALVRGNQLRQSEPDRNAAALANVCFEVPETTAFRLYDLAFYGGHHVSHVMVCLGGDWVLGASGGGPQTKGDDPRAFVKLERIAYRGDLICVGRIKDQYRPPRLSADDTTPIT